MTNTLLNTPVLWINEYLKEKLAGLTDIGLPIFPSRPSSIDELTESWVVIDGQQYSYQGVVGVWDRLKRMRRGPFPHIKEEQLLYYFYATQDNVTENMVMIQEAVLRLMDRGDETAEEVNNWAKGRTIANTDLTNKFYFHDFKVYQLEEVADIIDFGTARTYGGNKIIIEYKYHQMPELTNADRSLA